jgi:hypothetical protein
LDFLKYSTGGRNTSRQTSTFITSFFYKFADKFANLGPLAMGKKLNI